MSPVFKRLTLFGIYLGLVAAASFMWHDRETWWIAVSLSLVAGIGLVFLYRRERFTMREVLLGAILFRMVLFTLPPSLSDDVYRYIWDGRVQLEGLNPYLNTPQDAVETDYLEPDLVYDRLNSRTLHTVYPPVSQIVFAGLAVAERLTGSWLAAYYLLKLFFVGLELAGVFLLSRLAGAGLVMLYAWNPLVLLEIGGQPHTEAILVFLLVLAVWLSRRGRWLYATAALTAAVWVKLYPVFLLPVIFLRAGWRSIAVAAAVTGLVSAPYLAASVIQNATTSLDLYVRLFEFNAGPYYAAKEVLIQLTGSDHSKTIGPVFRWIFFASLPAIYFAGWRKKWPFERSALWILGAFFFLSTTVHPWYLLGILVLLPVLAPAAGFASLSRHWNWYALSICTIGTYLLYSGQAYWPFVIAGWSAWLLFSVAGAVPAGVDRLLKVRTMRKYSWIKPHLPSDLNTSPVLDLGAGEGWIGETIAGEHGAEVHLVDVVDFNRTDLKLTIYDGRHLPFSDDTFGTTIVYFVLHHSEDPEQIVREVARVTDGVVIVVESIYTGPVHRALLEMTDRVVNRLRSKGAMTQQEDHLNFRTDQEWQDVFRLSGLDIVDTERRRRLIDKQVKYVLQTRSN